MLENAAAQRADVLPQRMHPGEGLLLQLEHVVGCAAAATLAGEGAAAVPLVTGQRFGPLNWEETEGPCRITARKRDRGSHTYVQRPSGSGWWWTAPPRGTATPTGTGVELQASAKEAKNSQAHFETVS